MTVRYLIGDSRKVVASLPPASVDLVACSPAFLAVRSYLPDDHPDKALEMGSERTPAEWLDALLDCVEGWADVLAPHGSILVELGDTFAGSGGAGGDYDPDGLRAGQQRFDGSASKAYGTGAAPRPPRNRWRAPGPDPRYAQRGEQARGTGAGGDWPLDKSLACIPAAFQWALAYGRNPWTMRETPPWRVRNLRPWIRTNPPVGSLGDKVRPATSYIIVATKTRDRWIDIWQHTGSGDGWSWFCVCIEDDVPRHGFPSPSDALRDALAHHDKGDGR